MQGFPPDPNANLRVRVWDLPIRLFHWLVVVLFGFSWWSIENDHLDWHLASGYGILTLVLFRIYWGFAGGTTARFGDFVKPPRFVLAYARGLLQRTGPTVLGHNPLGGYSVLILVALLFVHTVLGLFAVDVDGLSPGPLSDLVSFDTGRRVAHWHGKVFDILLIFVALHIAAVAFYRLYKNENLIMAMVVGTKPFPPGVNPPRLDFAPLWRALLGLVAAGAFVAWIVFGRF